MLNQLLNLVGELHKQGVQLKSLTDAIDTAPPIRSGLEVARQPGRKEDRKRQMTDSQIESAKK